MRLLRDLLFSALLAAPLVAAAGTMTVHFTGTLTAVNPTLSPPFSFGDEVSGSFRFGGPQDPSAVLFVTKGDGVDDFEVRTSAVSGPPIGAFAPHSVYLSLEDPTARSSRAMRSRPASTSPSSRTPSPGSTSRTEPASRTSPRSGLE